MTLRLGLLGFGEVGRAFAERLAGSDDLRLVAVADRSGALHDEAGPDVAALLARKRREGSLGGARGLDAGWIARRARIDALVDLLPTDLRTGEPSRSLQLAALQRGVHVATANKGPLALAEAELRAAAAATGARHRASGAVAGGTPILELLGAAFRGDALERFEAVLNGSTNFVLSRLEEGELWEDAVAEARRRGILEADPALDLLGLDAAAKAVILANAAWGLGLRLSQARAQGITGIQPREALEARSNGMAIRLVARASREAGVSVAPVTLPRDHPLVVDGKENAIRLKLRHAGVVTLRGPGAGGAETASAVLGDLLGMAELPAPRAVAPLAIGRG